MVVRRISSDASSRGGKLSGIKEETGGLRDFRNQSFNLGGVERSVGLCLAILKETRRMARGREN